MTDKIYPTDVYENIQIRYNFFTDKDTSQQYISDGLKVIPLKDKINKIIDKYVYDTYHAITPMPKGVATLLSGIADNNITKTYIRTAHIDDYYYYKCDDNTIIKIGANYWDKSINDVVYFRPSNLTTDQILPIKSNCKLYDELLDIRLTKSERILLMGALVSAMIDDIAHPIINITGDAGVGKSILGVFIKDIIDPSQSRELGSLGTDKNLKLTLGNNICYGFDNLSHLTQSQSDILATASTGGSSDERVLYSDNEMISTVYNCMVITTGVDDTFKKPDILSRTLHIHLKNGDKVNINGKSFSYNLERIPYILGSIFDNLAYYIANRDTITSPSLIRLDDYYYVTLLTAINNGFSKDDVDKAFKINLDRNINQIITSSTLGSWIINNINIQKSFSGKMSNLYAIVNRESKVYKTPATIGKELNKLTPHLFDIGYIIGDKNTNTNIFTINYVGSMIYPKSNDGFDMGDSSF